MIQAHLSCGCGVWGPRCTCLCCVSSLAKAACTTNFRAPQLQTGAQEPLTAITAFHEWFSGVCSHPVYGNFFLATDNPAFDVAFINLYVCTLLHKPPLSNRGAHPPPGCEQLPERAFLQPIDVRSMVSGLPTSMLTAGRARRHDFVPAPWGSAKALIRNVLSASCPGRKTHMPDEDAFIIAWHFAMALSYVGEQAQALQQHLTGAAAMGITGNDIAVPGSFLHAALGLGHHPSRAGTSQSPSQIPMRGRSRSASMPASMPTSMPASMATTVTFSPQASPQLAGDFGITPPALALPEHQEQRPRTYVEDAIFQMQVRPLPLTTPAQASEAHKWVDVVAEIARVCQADGSDGPPPISRRAKRRLDMYVVHANACAVFEVKEGHYLVEETGCWLPCHALDKLAFSLLALNLARWRKGVFDMESPTHGFVADHRGAPIPCHMLDSLLRAVIEAKIPRSSVKTLPYKAPVPGRALPSPWSPQMAAYEQALERARAGPATPPAATLTTATRLSPYKGSPLAEGHSSPAQPGLFPHHPDLPGHAGSPSHNMLGMMMRYGIMPQKAAAHTRPKTATAKVAAATPSPATEVDPSEPKKKPSSSARRHLRRKRAQQRMKEAEAGRGGRPGAGRPSPARPPAVSAAPPPSNP